VRPLRDRGPRAQPAALRRIERAGGGVAGRTTALVGIATSTVSIWAWELAVVLWLPLRAAGITLPLVNWMLPRF